MGTERGSIGPLPYLGLGSGPPLLFLGGLSTEPGVDAAGTERMNASMLRPFAKRRRVMFTNRRSGLPRGMSMAELAAEHAEAIRCALGAPVDVAGISTGGSIAQQLAPDHPDTVNPLLLLTTPRRPGPPRRIPPRPVAARGPRGAPR